MESLKLVYKIARAYYEEGLTQQEIADKYGISRIKVSRLLSRAVSEEIVQIRLHPPEEHQTDLEQRLEKQFGLKEAVVVPVTDQPSGQLEESLGRAAAIYLQSALQGHEVVGLTWGRTLLSLVNALNPVKLPGLQVIQLLGGLGEPEAEYHGADLTRRMAQLFSTRPRLIHAPGIVRSAELCDELMNDLQVKSTLDLAATADVAVVGIGWLGPGSPLMESRSVLTESDKELLLSLNVVGDISLRFFDDRGRYVDSAVDRRVIGLTSAQSLEIPRVIGIAGGASKFTAIRAALTGGLVHVLITDRGTAEKLTKTT